MDATASRIVFLGTGTPNADPTRSGPAVAVVVNRTPYLVDAGPGVVRQAAAACRSGIAGLAVSRLSCLFVTHLHSDHTAGFPDLLLTPWVAGRREPLQVYGPPGVQSMSQHISAAYAEDIRERLEGLEPANPTGCRAQVAEIETGVVYEDSNVTVEAFPVEHGSWPAFAYRFRAPDRVIVISGDTAAPKRNLDAYRECDVLIHEVQSAVGLERRSPAWRRYHASAHTSSQQLAEVASLARPGLLVLYHQLFHGVNERALLEEVKQAYDGPVVSGKDLEVY
ncbi:MAG: MBL fold metallo-hydrolase [Anaerolineae bacterium]|jgi:ribonuclease BN (tRNA processing enzyme)